MKIKIILVILAVILAGVLGNGNFETFKPYLMAPKKLVAQEKPTCFYEGMEGKEFYYVVNNNTFKGTILQVNC